MIKTKVWSLLRKTNGLQRPFVCWQKSGLSWQAYFHLNILVIPHGKQCQHTIERADNIFLKDKTSQNSPPHASSQCLKSCHSLSHSWKGKKNLFRVTCNQLNISPCTASLTLIARPIMSLCCYQLLLSLWIGSLKFFYKVDSKNLMWIYGPRSETTPSIYVIVFHWYC